MNTANSATENALRAWRNELRAHLIAAREALPAAEHRAKSQRIERLLEPFVDKLAVRTLGFCWPFRAEFDARPLVEKALARGLRAGLPVVVGDGEPLLFREWTPQSEMVEDRYGIHIPAAGETLQPETLLMPLNAFDQCGYRLGYGGGYFDRTLAAANPRPVAIGVGFELAHVGSIRPHAHDLRMDAIVTETGIFLIRDGRLARAHDPAEAAEALKKSWPQVAGKDR